MIAATTLGLARELLPSEIEKLPMLPRSLMRGTGIVPAHGPRKSIPNVAKRAAHDGKFFVEESGLTLTHIQVLEGIMLSAFAGAECRNGELELRFRPGDVMRAMGLADGSRVWLRARLKEIFSTMGHQPRSATTDGGDFAILRGMGTDIPSAKVVNNVITGIDADGEITREEVKASVWAVRLSAGYRAWMASDTSLRHRWLKQLRALKCGAAEAVARFALTGHCNIPLTDLLFKLDIIEEGWDADVASATAGYQAARRAIKKILALTPELAVMGIVITRRQDGVYAVVAESKNPGMRFICKTAVSAVSAVPASAPAEVSSPSSSGLNSAPHTKFGGLAARLAARNAQVAPAAGARIFSLCLE